MTFTLNARCFSIALFLCVNLYALEQYWPEVFGNPEESDVEVVADTADTSVAATTPPAAEENEEIDSSSVQIIGQNSLLTTFKSKNSLNWQRLLPGGELNQIVSYQYSQPYTQNRIQTVDASGNVLFENAFGKGFDAGFLWSPVALYDKETFGTVKSNIYLGPMVSGLALGIPYQVKGGLYGYVENDSIAPWLLSTTDGSYRATPGVFGGLSCGSTILPLRSLPLQFSLNAIGRTADGNGVGLINAGVLFANDIGTFGEGDSLYFAVDDSLTNGKEVYIGEYGGSPFYSNTSWRVDHRFSTTAGIRFRQRLSTVTRAYYKYNVHSISYPNESTQQNDSRNRTNTVGVSARTRSGRPVVYSGGIEFDWEFEDKVFKHTFGDDDVPNPQERTMYIINQGDHYSDRARTDHDITVTLPAGCNVRYHLAAIKNSKRYPFVFRDSTFELRRNSDENDFVQIDHRVAFGYENSDSSIECEVYGKYWRKYHYYYHEKRTADSKKVDEYRGGCNVKLTRGPLSIREHFYLDAEISDYYFKKIGDIPVDAPPYSRIASSSLTGTWQLGKQLSLNGNWVNLYSDEGYWYGNAYRVPGAAGEEFYAIESKTTQYWLDFWFTYVSRWGDTLSLGSKFNDIFRRKYDFKEAEYRISDLDIGYGIEPYFKAELDRNRFGLSMYIRRIFNTRDAERWNRRKNWEMSLKYWLAL